MVIDGSRAGSRSRETLNGSERLRTVPDSIAFVLKYLFERSMTVLGNSMTLLDRPLPVAARTR